jgi:ribonucleoside-diphosphate reductase alpha chain
VDRPGPVAQPRRRRPERGRTLDELYRLAGLKTTYYLRTRSATHVEKSTLTGTDGKLTAVSVEAAPTCRIDDPDCEACQ